MFSWASSAFALIAYHDSQEGHHRAEAVVGVAKFWWDAAARGAAGELDVVAPGAASRRAADAVRGALRVHGGRDGVPGRIVPIAAPLVNVLAHVEQAVAI